jgi:hypothetical protein
LGFAGALVTWLATSDCGTSPVGVGACEQVEEARCRRAPACGVTLEPPYSTSGGDVAECIQFYKVACLHGLAVPNPGADAVNACVATIQTSPCDGRLPLFETDPACDWLTMSMSTADASTEPTDTGPDATDSSSDSADATSDVTDATTNAIDATTGAPDAASDALEADQ